MTSATPTAPSALDAVDLERMLRSTVGPPETSRSPSPSGDEPLAGRCRPDPDAGHYCWKFQHHDPTAPYDFWLLLTFRPGPRGTTVGSLVVPRDDGGLMHCVKMPIVHDRFESHYLKVMKASAGGFGPVSVAKMKVRVAHQETRRQIFGTRFLAGRYDDDLRLTAPYEEVSEDVFPPLPRHPGLTETAASARTLDAPWHRIDLPDAEPLGSLRFELAGSGESEPDALEVDGGEEVEPATAEDILSGTRPPGLYLDLADRSGLSLAVYSLVRPNERARILFVDYCTGFDKDHFYKRIIVKKSSSWFSSKKKIIIIREELRESDVTCGVLYAGTEVSS